MPDHLSFALDLPAHSDSLARIHEAVGSLWSDGERMGFACDEGVRDAFHLAVVEVSTNIIRHAYRDANGGFFRMRLTADRDHVTAVFEDRGRPFERRMPRPYGPRAAAFEESDIGTLPEGGYGLDLVARAVEILDYERSRDGRNRWLLRKSCRLAA